MKCKPRLWIGFFSLLLPLLALVPGWSGSDARAEPEGKAPQAEAQNFRQVFLGGGLDDEELIQFGSCLAASPRAGRVVLLDSPPAHKANQAFVAAFAPQEVIAVGSFPEGVAALEKRLGKKPAHLLQWKRGPPAALWRLLFPQAVRVVVCPATPRRLLLHSAALAGTLRAPLFVTRGAAGESAELRRWLLEWKTQEVLAVDGAGPLCREVLSPPADTPNETRGPSLTGVQLRVLASEEALTSAYRRSQLKNGPIQALVAANPADSANDLGKMSLLAPWLAVQKRAALLLTQDKGDNTGAVVKAALELPELAQADTLILSAGLKAIPTERRPNPAEGKDAEIEMEPLTPRGNDTFSFATGRLFHEDPALVFVQLARQQLLPVDFKPRKALVVSNPGGGLPLLETFSRHTANELRNAGYRTTALFEDQANKELMRKLLPQQDVFLWEGHYRTLIDDYGFLTWDEPLPPAFYFLQSCLALKEEEIGPLMQRGAMAFLGSSTRIYSGTGGAFTVAFFDATIYDAQSLGGALRQAKNYLLCYSLLKEKRLGPKAKLTGANVRSAWAFTLWGDPTLTLPRPEKPAKGKELPAVRSEVRGNTILLELPEVAYPKVTVGRYNAEMVPNARLAGLLTAEGGEDQKSLVPFVFAEVSLPKAPAGKKPQLHSQLPSRTYVFCWDERRRTGYLLVTPRSKAQHELRFRVEWVD